MIKHCFWLVFCLLASTNLLAQCEVAFDEIDDFDSLRTVSAHPVSFGFMIPSLYETVDGPKLIEEGKALAMFSQNDSINSFFLTLAIPEYTYRSIKPGHNVLLKLSDGEVISFYNVPDKGTFDEETNMRLYQHTIVLPIDMYYRLTFSTIEAIRIQYQKFKHTFRLTEQQQLALREAMQCVGRQVELYPVKP